MRLIDQLTTHPLLEERHVNLVFEPMGFEVHVEILEDPDPDEHPEESERYLADVDGYIDSLPLSVPEGFTELGRWESEDGGIVMLAVKPTTPLASLLMLPVDAASSITAIATERRRQVEAEGWSPEHDDAYAPGILAAAGAFYADHGIEGMESAPVPPFWPFPDQWWRPGSARRNLEKAGALIAAELDRLARAEGRQS